MALSNSDKAFTPNVLSIHCAELVLKGNNRPQFTRVLRTIVAERLKAFGVHSQIYHHGARLLFAINSYGPQTIRALHSLEDIPGIASYFAARLIPWAQAGSTPDQLLGGPVATALVQLANACYRQKNSFAVRVDRHTRLPAIGSMTLEKEWGSTVCRKTAWTNVNLSRPDRVFRISLQPEGVLVSGERHKGLGGLPVGSGGNVLSLLSGGIDSPLASVMIAQRGCSVDCLHVAASFLDVTNLQDTPVAQIATELVRFTGQMRLFVAPFMHFDLATIKLKDKNKLLIFRRFLAQLADRLANERDYNALVTGDSLNQVASQTPSNLRAMDVATRFPIFRPLIGLSKQEIIERASTIGTYSISIQPQKDCCSLVQRHPRTHAKLSDLDQLESRVFKSHPNLLGQTLAQTHEWLFEFGSSPIYLGCPFGSTNNE